MVPICKISILNTNFDVSTNSEIVVVYISKLGPNRQYRLLTSKQL